MLYMNRHDIEDTVRKYADTIVLGKAARFLAAYQEEVDTNSDGWAHWGAPVRAAKKLMELFDNPAATEADFRKSLAPIRSFYTKLGNKAGMKFPPL